MSKRNAVWVTGSSSGIGKALAAKFISQNHYVIGTARSKNIIDEINPDSSKSSLFKYIVNDVSNSEDVFTLFTELSKDNFINCLINNAGITSFKPFAENSYSEIDSIIKTNLNGAIYTIKSVLPDMIANNTGTIINILSVAAKKTFVNSSVYAASKAGLEAFSKVLREEVRSNNIKVINIFPGATSTAIWPESTIQEFSNKMMTPEKLANFIYDIYNNSSFLSPEELIVRPISGDL